VYAVVRHGADGELFSIPAGRDAWARVGTMTGSNLAVFVSWCCALLQEAAVTAQPIAPVIPSPGRLAGTPRVRPAAVRPLSLAGPAAALSAPAGVVYGTGRIDASGRVTDQAVTCAPRRRPGARALRSRSRAVPDPIA